MDFAPCQGFPRTPETALLRGKAITPRFLAVLRPEGGPRGAGYRQGGGEGARSGL